MSVRDEPEGAVLDEAGRALVPRLRVARRFLPRLVGLLGRKGLEAGEGLLLERCGGIHTCGMRFAIDAVFLDAEWRVLRVACDLRPWRAARVPGARSVLELPAGSAARLELRAGRRLCIRRRPAPTGPDFACGGGA